MTDLMQENMTKAAVSVQPAADPDAAQAMTPRDIVARVDRYIIGQDKAKRAVAIALRNRWRRMQLPKALRREITPKNILMIGPTGVGKTEIARRLADLVDAPFIKVEATKFTEVGYVGRDVEQIIRDLIEVSIKRTRDLHVTNIQVLAEAAAVERVLDVLLPKSRGGFTETPDEQAAALSEKEIATRELFKKKLLKGDLDDKEIEIALSNAASQVEIMGPPGMEEMVGQLQNMMQNFSERRPKTRRLPIKEALKHLQEEESESLINFEDVKAAAIRSVEQNGIVFLDEIDKIVKTGNSSGGEVSRDGVQRDLLPLVEGSTVSTKYGMIKTDHILFIGSGAFHLAKPSDLIPELQGRFPIRVELSALTVNDFVRILTEPEASLTEQYRELMGTEQFSIHFTTDGIDQIAQFAYQINDHSENIGARRLHTILERLLESISFDASEMPGESLTVNQAYVKSQLEALTKDQDLSQYIL